MRSRESTCVFAAALAHAPRGARRGARPGARRRSGSRPRCARRAGRRGPGSRSRPRGPPTRRSPRSAATSSATSGRKVTSVALVARHVLAGAEQADAGDHRVRASRELARASAPRRPRPGGLAVDRPSSTTVVSTPSVSRPSRVRPSAPCPLRAPDELDGVGIRRVVLGVVGRDDLEGDRELLEDRPPLRRRRGEGRRRLRATQISSAGQLARPFDGQDRSRRASSRPPAAAARSGARSRSPALAGRGSSRRRSRWNSIPSSGGQSKRCRPKYGRWSASVTSPASRVAEVSEGRAVRKTRRPTGRRSRAASGIQRYGSPRRSRRTPTPRGRSRHRATARPRRPPPRAGTRCRSRTCTAGRSRAGRA